MMKVPFRPGTGNRIHEVTPESRRVPIKVFQRSGFVAHATADGAPTAAPATPTELARADYRIVAHDLEWLLSEDDRKRVKEIVNQLRRDRVSHTVYVRGPMRIWLTKIVRRYKGA
jgi:hypothetical protein